MSNAILKALNVLEAFSRARPSLSLTDLSATLGIPKSTTHRILSTLVARGFVIKLENDHYALGNSVIALAQSSWINVNVRDRAATVARSLSEKCRESIYVAVPDGDEVLYVYAIETTQRLTARTAVGDRAPYYCTGVGKAMLPFLPEQQLGTIIDLSSFVAHTPATIVTRDAFMDEVGHIRQRGYSIDNAEHELDTYCIAAPFFDASSRVAGAISVSGRDPEPIRGSVDERAALVVESAREISSRLGYIPSHSGRLQPM